LKYFRTFLYILTLFGVCVFLYLKRDDIHYLVEIHYTKLLLLFAAGLITVIFNAFLFKNTISIFDLNLPFKEWFGLTITNTMYNYLLPARGGIALRALYMKNNYRFSYSQYISLTAGTYIISLFTAAFFATALSIIIFLIQKANNIAFLYISFSLLIVISGLLFVLYHFNPQRIAEKNKIFKFLKNIAIGLKQFKEKRNKVFKIMLIQMGLILAMSLRLFIAYMAIDILSVNFTKLVFINSLVAFSMVFSITPGNIGIKEGIIGLSYTLLDISFDQAILGALLDRLVTIIIVFVLGLVFSNFLIREIKYKKTNIEFNE